MYNLTDRRNIGIISELEEITKEAFSPIQYIKSIPSAVKAAPGKIRNWAGTEGGTAWLGRLGTMGVGSGLGAATGALTTPEGEDAGTRAAIGAVLGGVGGFGAGQFVTGAGRRQIKRFGQRQLHGITGYVPGHGIFGTKGMAGLTPEEQLAKRMEGLKQMRMSGALETATPAERAATEAGLTSIPGFAKGIFRGPNKAQALRAAVMSGGKAGLAMGAGMGALDVVTAAKPPEPGQTRAGNIGRAVGSTLGYMAASPLPMVGNMVVGDTLGAVGKAVGTGIGKIVGPRSQISPVGSIAPQMGV